MSPSFYTPFRERRIFTALCYRKHYLDNGLYMSKEEWLKWHNLIRFLS